MTISATSSEISHATDGVTTDFPIPFVFDTSADLKVIKTDSSGNATVLSSGFSVAGGAGSTGTLTISPALVSGYTITILDDPQRTQTADYISNDAFPAETHEGALDRGVRISKRLYQMLLRTLRFPDGDGVADGQLDAVANRKGKYLFFNATTGAPEYAAQLSGSTLSSSLIGTTLDSLKRTAAEISAGVTPVNYAYPPGDVRRYGAIGDGISDDTAAIQAALNCQREIYLPAGTYKVTSSLQFKGDGQVLYGDGRYGQTIVNWGGGTNDVVIENNGTTLRNNITIRDFRIELNGGTGKDGCIAIDFSHFDYSSFERLVLVVYGNTTRGVYGIGRTTGDRPYYNQFKQIDCFSNNINGGTTNSVAYYLDRVLVSNFNYNGPNANRFSGGRISGFDTMVKMIDGNGNVFRELIGESMKTAHYDFGATFDDSGTATAGAINTLTDSGKSWAANQFVGGAVEITGGTGSGQFREILSNTSTAITVNPYWRTLPDATSTYRVYSNHGQGNVIVDAYAEGDAPSNPSFLVLRPGVQKTMIRGGEISSLGSGLAINASLTHLNDKFQPGNWSDLIPITFFSDNLAASQTNLVLGIPGQVVSEILLPGSWHVHSANIRCSAAITAGSAQLWVTADGTKINSTADVLLNSSNTFNATGAIRQDIFSPSLIVNSSPAKRIGMVVTTDAGWLPAGTNDLYITLFVQIRG